MECRETCSDWLLALLKLLSSWLLRFPAQQAACIEPSQRPVSCSGRRSGAGPIVNEDGLCMREMGWCGQQTWQGRQPQHRWLTAAGRLLHVELGEARQWNWNNGAITREHLHECCCPLGIYSGYCPGYDVRGAMLGGGELAPLLCPWGCAGTNSSQDW